MASVIIPTKITNRCSVEQSLEKQMALIRRRVVEIITEKELEAKVKHAIETGKPLKVKLGLDPNRPDIHIGHMVVIDKLRDFQELGHEVVLIVGTFTGFIGDPSERDSTRPQISLEEVMQHAGTYFEQVQDVLDPDKTQIVSNADWLMPLNFADILGIASKVTVAQILERDDFQMRYRDGKPISLQEFLYPLAQAYDSVAVESDIELGGTDQKFNCLVGRDLQRAFGQEPQCVITTPLLVGTDGEKKMSKSLDNYIGITDDPDTMYGRVMSIPDAAMIDYYKLATYQPLEWIDNLEKELKSDQSHPMDAKKELARIIVTRYHSKEAASKAEGQFMQVFSKRELPDEMQEYGITKELSIVELLRDLGFASSNSEAKRLIKQGGVSIGGKKITDFEAKLEVGNVQALKSGKRRFAKLFNLLKMIEVVCGDMPVSFNLLGAPGLSARVYELKYDGSMEDAKGFIFERQNILINAKSPGEFIEKFKLLILGMKDKHPEFLEKLEKYFNQPK